MLDTYNWSTDLILIFCLKDHILPHTNELQERPIEGGDVEETDVKDTWDTSSDSDSEKEAVEVNDEKDPGDSVENHSASESDGSSDSTEESGDDEESESESESEESDSEDHKTAAQSLREKVIARIQVTVFTFEFQSLFC